MEQSARKVDAEAVTCEVCTGTDLAAKLQSTGNKLLAESGKDRFFSCGLPLTHVDVLDPSKWKSNMIGKLQMQIRNDLNKA